ncbi:MAG: bifunctional adenosylcobinamide kinase/adenosylcobinamide-phosphate guanylyltransferase [Dehalococcoidia bacterium]|nr:bifunctional adenosylcobinamide kinase/adenosylcobinamide-phosphate guanylyltransferase [Dehalococcoidia bacterium]MYI86734.1 bifunctional adenosylcobinamide kinase/adenosylcobinamide-phosphate guanylyltransferase [Dehalococcoidia bacterium]
MSKELTLILGGARAGKSTYAQRLAEGGERVLFVATAEAGDEQMEARIRAHRESRPAEWDTLEEPIDLVGALMGVSDRYDTILLDCLTLWVSNLLLQGEDHPNAIDVPGEARRLLAAYEQGTASWIVVSNEVGLGVVPPTELGRLYADELGRVNQMVAAAADHVYFMAAGLPLKLKPSGEG